MSINSFSHNHLDRMVEGATHPIELRWGTLAALLLLAGISPPRRLALPAHPITAHSGVSNYRF